MYFPHWVPQRDSQSRHRYGMWIMSDWFLNLSIPWTALIIFAATYLIAACVYLVVVRLAVGDRARAFKAFSPDGNVTEQWSLITLSHRSLHASSLCEPPARGASRQVEANTVGTPDRIRTCDLFLFPPSGEAPHLGVGPLRRRGFLQFTSAASETAPPFAGSRCSEA